MSTLPPEVTTASLRLQGLPTDQLMDLFESLRKLATVHATDAYTDTSVSLYQDLAGERRWTVLYNADSCVHELQKPLREAVDWIIEARDRRWYVVERDQILGYATRNMAWTLTLCAACRKPIPKRRTARRPRRA